MQYSDPIICSVFMVLFELEMLYLLFTRRRSWYSLWIFGVPHLFVAQTFMTFEAPDRILVPLFLLMGLAIASEWLTKAIGRLTLRMGDGYDEDGRYHPSDRQE